MIASSLSSRFETATSLSRESSMGWGLGRELDLSLSGSVGGIEAKAREKAKWDMVARPRLEGVKDLMMMEQL